MHDTLDLLTWCAAEGTANASLMGKLAKMGEIRVEVIRCAYLGVLAAPRNKVAFEDIDETIPEKALKGRSISNHAKYVKGQSCGDVDVS